MSETRFNLRRPNTDPASDVESYIDRGTAALPSEKETGIEETPEKIRRLVVLLPTARIASSSSWPQPAKQPCPTFAALGSKTRSKSTSLKRVEKGRPGRGSHPVLDYVDIGRMPFTM